MTRLGNEATLYFRHARAGQRSPSRGGHRWWTGRPVDELLAGAARRGPSRTGARPGRLRVAGAALGHLLPGDAELAVSASGLSVRGTGPGRVHGARRCGALPA